MQLVRALDVFCATALSLPPLSPPPPFPRLPCLYSPRQDIGVVAGAAYVCPDCRVVREDDSGHCPTCNVCVRKRDHHCVFTGTCIGAGNASAFYVFYAAVAVHFSVLLVLLTSG